MTIETITLERSAALFPDLINNYELFHEAVTPEQILKLAVKRMMPGGPLAKKQLSKLKIYTGDDHPHEVQNPTIVNFKDLNKKNTLSN